MAPRSFVPNFLSPVICYAPLISEFDCVNPEGIQYYLTVTPSSILV
ncbi:heat shock protein [Synechococcus phage S-SM1]|uniref:Heat shock protein n=1 Tax=Synechococcus phage S-SM1 TaxID=444859 RepID=E3SIH7_9CAUD|nr:heat shock protein [Synechococcus phage S-SM1]ADO97180.1 heat shock protein [Synechococcus phage S-SM1]